MFFLAISAKGNNLCKFLFASKGEKQSPSETRGFNLNEIISTLGANYFISSEIMKISV